MGVIVGVGIQVAFAWTAPSQSAPNGNVAGPVTVGTPTQYKDGLLNVRDLGVINNVVINKQLHVLTQMTAPSICLSGDCRSAWPGGSINNITGSGGITVNNVSGNVTVGTDPNALAAALFSNVSNHSCNNYSGGANPLFCSIPGNKNMCFLTNVFGRDGDDVDGFGCSVYGTVGGSWTIRAVGEDYDQTYCQVACI